MGTSHKSKALLKRDTPLIHRPSELSFTSISTLGIHGVEYDLDDILGEENEKLNKDEWNTGNRSRKSKSKPRSASNVCSDPGCDIDEELSNLCIQSQHQDYNSDNSNGEKKLDSFPERHRRKSFVDFLERSSSEHLKFSCRRSLVLSPEGRLPVVWALFPVLSAVRKEREHWQ